MKAKNNKIKRYQSRIYQHQQNCTFKNNQGKFYMELNSGRRNYETTELPDKKEAQEFWRSTWEEGKEHQKVVELLENFKRDFEYKEEQVEVENTTEKVKKILRKMPNWKAPGPDFVHGFWLKKYSRNLQKCLKIETWHVDDKGENKTNAKRQKKSKAACNYRPITCLPLVWKLLTGVVAEEIYEFLNTNFFLPQEQKGCRRKF